jgi:2-alkenal reductase
MQRGFFGTFQIQSEGSGVIIDRRGYIVTNNHVVAGARALQVIYADGMKADATVVGADALSDLAVLKVDGNVPAVAELGDSGALQPGETVIAIGSPLGQFKGTVTVGVVSGLDRKLQVDPNYALEGLIQTDAAINHGNSGGPLINLAGQVVGINTAIVRSGAQAGGQNDIAEGLGFAVPSATVKDVAEQIMANGRVERPYLGVENNFRVINPRIASAYGLPVRNGVYVVQVDAGSPAARAGIRQGDIITKIAEQTIDEDHPLLNALIQHKVGEQVTVTVVREGRELAVTLELAARPG